ncbi:hypothetical protein HRI_002179700 [Hibiscus trionum]|uniref:Uncharacterized protein n=1 Tax=Hibiscus trionum TaxID=183268 RepID=A0A9W7HWV5_HIBTR|nr:hypothetical protein HRI_002179700 [Hibiscus trionum]
MHEQKQPSITNQIPATKQGGAMEFPKLHAGRPLESSEGETFGVILSRSRSVSSASTVALRAEKQSSALENAVKRAFSMRRSRSTSSSSSSSSSSYCVSTGRGGYYKIFHHFDDADPISVDESHNFEIKSRKRRGSKIFEACKRLMGF